MKNLLTILFIFISGVQLNAQSDVIKHQRPPLSDSNDIYEVVEVMPEFPNGFKALDSFVKANFNMPAQAAEVGAQGKIFVSFIVNIDSTVSDIKVIKDNVGWGCAEEALRVFKLMAETHTWSPGKQLGKPVRVRFRYPIVIKMDDKKSGTSPEYPGGNVALDEEIFRILRYPAGATQIGAYGKVVLGMTITKDGVAKDIHIKHDGIGFGVAQECLRTFEEVVENKTWIPSSKDGEDIDSYFAYTINIKQNFSSYYCPEPNVQPESLLGDSVLKQKLLKKVLKKYDVAPGDSSRKLIVDILITEAGKMDYVHITHNDFDKKFATKVRGALYPEQDRFSPGRLNGVAMRCRYRIVITQQDIADYYLTR